MHEDTPPSALVAQPLRPTPPRQGQGAEAGAAEFVICDHTIEFTFRDAKQYWGLEDFMVVTETAVTNAMNLAFFMVNLSRRLVRERRQSDPNASVLDLKADYRGRAYAEEVIKLLPEKPEPGLLQRLLAAVTGLGRIHPLSAEPSPE